MAGFAKPLEDEIIEDSEPEREEHRLHKKLRRKALNKKVEILPDDVDSPRKRVPVDRKLQDRSIIIISGESSLVFPGDHFNEGSSDDSDTPLNIAVQAQQCSAKENFGTEEQSQTQPTSTRVSST